MEVLTDFTLEEFSPENKYHFIKYSNSFEDFSDSKFCEPNYIDYDDRSYFYEKNRSLGLDEDCQRLNSESNSYLEAMGNPCQMYFMIRASDYRAVGMIQIYCGHSINNDKTFVPEVIYEISPSERGKGYGKTMVDLLLENYDIGVEYFYFNVTETNEASVGLMESLDAEIIDNDNADTKTYRLHVK